MSNLKINMIVRPKSPELIQAQAANYAAMIDNHDPDKENVYAGLGNTAMLRSTFADDPAVYPEYVTSIRETLRNNPDAIAERAKLATAFSKFAEPVADLLSTVDLSDLEKVENHPAYLGRGSSSYGFLFTSGDKQYVAKVARSRYEVGPRGKQVPVAEVTDRYTIAAMRTQGIPHLEQVVAISYDKGVVVSEVMPGKDASQLTQEDREAITDTQIEVLAETLLRAEEAGVMVELINKANLFYDRQAGFGFIDCFSVDHPLKDYIDYYNDRENVVSQVFMAITSTERDKPDEGDFHSRLYRRYADIMEDAFVFKDDPYEDVA